MSPDFITNMFILLWFIGIMCACIMLLGTKERIWLDKNIFIWFPLILFSWIIVFILGIKFVVRKFKNTIESY